MTGTVDGTSQVRKYRGSPLLKASVAVLLFTFAGLFATFAVVLVRAADAPFAVTVPFGALAGAMLALMVSFVRSATIVGPDHITVRDAGTRRAAWPDIVAIEVEENVIHVEGRAKPVENVAVYTRDGRRLLLPNLAGSRKLSLRHEVRAIREVWERRRGEDWTPQPAVTEAAKARSAAGERIQGSVVGAMGCGYTAMRLTAFGVVVICLIALATGNADDLPGVPGWVFVAVLGGVGVAPLAVVLLAGLARDRGQDRGR